jgi:hypothetical protein
VDIKQVELNGEDITEDVVAHEAEVVADEPAFPTAEEAFGAVAQVDHIDIHANDDIDMVKEELAARAEIEAALPLPDDFPSQEEIDAWRARYGRIRIRRLGPGEAYIIRPLQRGEAYEYERLASEAEANEGITRVHANMELEEVLVSRCLLYPKATKPQLHGSDPEFNHPILVAGTIGFLALDTLVISNLMGEIATIAEDL